jgi:hypothetical protein
LSSTSFVDGVTLVQASWCNDVDTATYSSLTAVSGTNTITATGPSSQVAYTTGQIFRFIPSNTNTGATTLNISALGAKSIFLNGQALAGGELFAGIPVMVEYDGTQFDILANGYKRLKLSPTGTGKNIAARTNSGTPNTKLDITADEILLTNSTGQALRATTVSGTIDFGTVGANGLDASTQAVSTWYYGYVIAKEDGTVAVLGSTSATAPTMPTGYTFKALVTAARSNGSTQFVKYRQFGNKVYYEARQSAVSSGTATTETTITTTSLIPPIAEAIFGDGSVNLVSGAGAASVEAEIRVVSGSTYARVGGEYIDTASTSRNGFGSMWQAPNTGALLYLNFQSGVVSSSSVTINVCGFKLPLGGE